MPSSPDGNQACQMTVLLFLALGYAAFFVLHLFAKMLHLWWNRHRLQQALAKIPGYLMSPFGSEYIANHDHFREWKTDLVLAYPGAKMVKFIDFKPNVVMLAPEAVEHMLQHEWLEFSKPRAGSQPVGSCAATEIRQWSSANTSCVYL